MPPSAFSGPHAALCSNFSRCLARELFLESGPQTGKHQRVCRIVIIGKGRTVAVGKKIEK